MRNRTFSLLIMVLISISSLAQPSPWGTGNITNQNIGVLASTNTTLASHVNESFALNDHLTGHSYNIYIPPNYDGTEAYGLITYINSGDAGDIPDSWKPVLDEKKLILIAGNAIGNSVFVHERIGTGLAGAVRLQEVLNIDPNRIYVSGASGGARCCSDLLFYFPEIFKAMVPNCGASYLRKVDQDYETQQPDSHYEYQFQYTAAAFDYVKGFNPAFAYMTAFDDFREGDLMNIYHNGAEIDGFRSKLLETAGGHCTTTTDHFRDAVNFVEHPHINIVKDSFANINPIFGNGYSKKNATVENNYLNFKINQGGNTSVNALNSFKWNDKKGAIIRLSYKVNTENFNKNSYFNVNLLDIADQSVIPSYNGKQVIPGVPNLLISIQHNALQPKAYIILESPGQGISSDTLFSAVMNDWVLDELSNMKIQLWSDEIRIEFGNHFDAQAVVTKPSAKLLDDMLSVMIRPAVPVFAPNDFSQGTMFSLYAGKLNGQENCANIGVKFLQIISATEGGNIALGTPTINLQSEDLKIFPNPNKGSFFLKSTSKETKEINMYNSIGQLVKSFRQVGHFSSVDVTNLPKGIYFLTVNGVTQNQRIIIQ